MIPNIKERIDAFNDMNRPFYIVDHNDGIFSLCLPVDLLNGEYADYCQRAFNSYAKAIGEPVKDEYGAYTHGNGYEWESAFREAFKDDPQIDKVIFDSEAGGFFCNSHDLSVLENLGKRFKDMCGDNVQFTMLIARGIEHQAEREQVQERLLSTVRGQMMSHPNSDFDILTPDGRVYVSSADVHNMLGGYSLFIQIGRTTLTSDELLDQHIEQMQTDIFDQSLIRMKTDDVGFTMTPTHSM